MLHLITGKKGAGKELLTLSIVEERRIKENRKVYYNGIPELLLDWIEFDDPKEWHKLPPDSIIVIGEADLCFPVRPNTSAVPEYISMFKFDRKTGLDIYLSTQNPKFIDNFVRECTDIHFHLMRKFGAEISVLHQFTTVRLDVATNRKDSISKDFPFPKQFYGMYKSAEIHNIPNHTPFRYYLKFIIPVVVVALCFAAYYFFNKAIHKGEKTINDNKTAMQNTAYSPGQTNNNSSGAMHNEKLSQADDLLNYYRMTTPRIPSLALTAPKYDEVTKPTVAPVPAACIASKKKCDCYSQQGTKMLVEDTFCRSVVANGYFVDFDNNKGSVQPNINKAGDGMQSHVDSNATAVNDEPTRYVEPRL